MLNKFMITLLVLVGSVAFAQNNEVEVEGIDNDVDVVEENISRTNDSDTRQANPFKGDNSATDTANSPQINIFNANSNANKQNQKNKSAVNADQATDQVADIGVTAEGAAYISRANDIRNARKSMEIGTEQKVVEKIEWSRIEDEKERAQRLFGNRLESKYKNNYNDEEENYVKDDYKKEEKPQVVIIEKPAYEKPAYVAPTPAPVYPVQEVVTEKKSKIWGEETYIAPLIGTSEYTDADNVSGNMALGVLFGSRFDSNVAVEASFLKSNFDMDDYTALEVSDGYYRPAYRSVDQYGFALGVKYNLEIGRLMPHIGGLLGYTYREYGDSNNGYDYSATSTAVDAGLSLGADLRVTKNFSVGAEYRMMKNLSSDRDNDAQPIAFVLPPGVETVEPLEDLDYQAFLVTGKFSF